MGQKKRTEKLVLNIGIALTAGMFSIVPVAYGAPVSDGVKTAGVAIEPVAAATAGCVDTNITSTAQNNVIGWQDFSVAKGESVNFNDKHNYLNIVSGQNTSQIDGAINSQGGNIYLVNPNGVIFGKGSSVNVGAGSFNVSTRYLDSAKTAKTVTDTTAISTVIDNASPTVASDIVNMGSIAANSVVLEGNNIRFMNAGTAENTVNVTNNDITFQSSGYTHIGNTSGNAVDGYKINGTASTALSDEAKANTYYKLIHSLDDIADNGTGSYMLAGNIDLQSGDGYSKNSGTFSGKLDGMGFTIQDLNTKQGLFPILDGAAVYNLGIVDAKINADGTGQKEDGFGALAGKAQNGTTIYNVYSTGGTINGKSAGGIVGRAGGMTLGNSYSEDELTSDSAGGLVGYVAAGENEITNSYFIGSAAYGFVGGAASQGIGGLPKITIENSYSKATTGAYFEKPAITAKNSVASTANAVAVYDSTGKLKDTPVYSSSDMNYHNLYESMGWDITSTGGVTIDKNTGAVTRPTWRIYEGRNTPVLTSMLKGIKTVSYNYGYFKADGSQDTQVAVYNNVTGKTGIGSNVKDGKSIDLLAYDKTAEPEGLIYNGDTLKIVDKDDNALNAKDVASFFKTTGASTVDVADVNYDVNGQKNSTYDASSKTTKKLALLWSNQQGYDLVGGNISISPRTVTVNTEDFSNKKVEKDYDGSASANNAFKSLISGSSTTSTGILAADADNVTVEFSGNVSFVDGNGQADSSVGTNKDVKFEDGEDGEDGGFSLSYSDDAAGRVAKNNYVLESNFQGGQTLSGVGTINQAKLVIDFASGYGTGINKTYDGTADVVNEIDANNNITKQNLPTADMFTLTGIITHKDANNKDQGEDVRIDLGSATANYINSDGSTTKNAGDHAVRYGGLKLTGTAAQNYRLVNADGDVLYSEAYNGVGTDVNKTTGGHLDGSGTIAKKNISLGGFSVNGADQGAEKTYDDKVFYDGALGQNVYSDEVIHNADKTVWDDLTFTVTNDDNGHSGYFTKQEGSTDTVANAGTGYGVGYHVTIGGSDADNYQINGADITNGSTAIVTGSGGTIKKRVITLDLGNKTTDIDKTYDGDNSVKVMRNNQLTSDIVLSDGLVKYADGSDQLITTDGTKLSIVGEYDSKDVKKSNTYGLGDDQGIKYTVSVVDGTIADKASNYVFKTQDGAATQTITGATGAINPVHIKNIQFADVEKTYDTSAQVKGEQDKDKISVTDITDGTKSVLVGTGENKEKLADIIDTTKIMGIYGTGNNDAAFSANPNVQRDNDNNVISGTVKYTGKDAQGKAASLKDSIISTNYVLDEDSDYGKGTINPLTIKDMTLAHSEISKAYDGEATVAYTDAQGIKHEAGEFVGALSTKVGQTDVALTYEVKEATYDSENVARDTNGNVTQQNVTYKIKVEETGNFAVDGDLKDDDGYVTKVFKAADGDGGIITPRKLKAQAAADGFAKTYDATNVVYDSNGTPLSGNGVVTFIGYDNAADGLLTKDQTANKSSAVYTNVDADTGKAINYTAQIGSGSDAIANNYDIYVSNDNTNWTKGTSFTANNGVINKAGLQVTFDDVNKKYDGNAYLKDTYNNDASLISPNYHGGIKSRSGTADDVHVSFASQEDSVFDSADVARDANGQVTSQNVTYKFTLEGAQAGNYFIADANGNEVTTKEGEKTVLNGRGTISPKNLTDVDVTLNFDAVNKVYDTNSNISYNHSAADYGDQAGSQDAADYINQFIIGGVVLKNGQTDTKGENYSAAGIYLNSAGTETSGVDANKAKFTITLTDKALSNFDLSSVSFFDATAKTLTKTTDAGTASITPKNVTVSFHDPEVTKVYNGKKDVVAGSTQANPDGTALAIGTNILNVSGIISGDKAELDRDNVNARYADKNVAYDSAGKVTSKDVYYDAVLKGDNAANYKLVYGTKGSTLVSGKPSLTITGKGTITPKEISADFNYDGNVAASDYNKKAGDTTANKAYDAKDTINSLSSKNIAGVNGEVIKLSDNNITGTYGKWTADASGAQTGIGAGGQTEKGSFTANGDVNWLGTGSTEDEKTGYKAVKYTGLQQALENATDANNAEGFSGKNYTIADTVYFTEAAKKGKIRQLALTANDVKTKWTTPITKEYDGTDVVQNAKEHLSLYTDVTGTDIDIKYDLKSAVYDNDQVNVVSGHGVTYTLNDLEPQEFTNFKMDADMLSSFRNKEYKNTGSITPRVLKIKTDNLSGYTKTYDGERTVKDAAGNIINNFAYTFEDDHGIVDKDKNTVNLTVTGAYADEDAKVDPDSTAKSGKQIDYTLKLTGNTAGNYTLDSSNTLKGAATEEDKDTYKGDGAIKRRVVYADFADGYGRDINKEYNGDDAADADKKQRNHINLLDGTDENTGVIQAEKNAITLLADSISAAYAGKDVARDSQGKVTTQEVYFSNFQLDGATKDNYVVKAKGGSDTLTGSGTITPRTVNVSVKEGPVKEYDRDTSLADKYLDKANINVDNTNVIGGDTVGVFIQSGSYTDGNADTGKDYTYQLGWTNGNYALKDTTAGESLTTDGMTAELTGHNGTIEKRLLTVTDVTRAVKTYDGTDGVENAAGNIVLDDRIIKGDNIGLKVSGVYTDGADAAAGEDTDALLDHDVSYTLSLDNTNYQLDKTSAAGKGTIRRKGLDIVAEPQKINVGETIPSFTGSVLGLEEKDSNLADAFTFAPKDEKEISNSIPGKYGVYGWYKGKTAGNVGQNYTFSQNPANEEAFIVNLVDPGREYHDTVNPKSQFRPDQTAYQQSSMDDVSAFGGMAKAALEYRDTKGTVLGITTISSGDVHELEAGGNISEGLDGDLHEIRSMDNRERLAKIGITGSDVVNMENVDAGSVANIQVDSQGEIVNLEIVPLSGETSNRDADAEIQSAV